MRVFAFFRALKTTSGQRKKLQMKIVYCFVDVEVTRTLVEEIAFYIIH